MNCAELIAPWTRRVDLISDCPAVTFSVTPHLKGGEERCLLPLLDPCERERAARFVFSMDRTHFIVRRAARRIIIADFLNISPQDLEIETDRFGRALLPRNSATSFSCSASRSLALISVANNCQIGVDVEYISFVPEAPAIVDTFFARSEVEEFGALSDSSRDRAFIEFWTAKEAYLKAIGTGLAKELNSVEICREKRRARPLNDLSASDSTWSLTYFQPDRGAIAALCWAAGPTLGLGPDPLRRG